MPFKIEFISAIEQIDAADWNQFSTDYPFNRYEFLHALEASGSVGKNSGWHPHHLLIFNNDTLIAVMPNYLKGHSWGEYVFDWAWAEAYERYGLQYYPKLVAAIPFTPATGTRLCTKQSFTTGDYKEIAAQVKAYCEAHKISGWHVLFPPETEATQWQASDINTRTGLQYHWFNNAYTCFDDFLAECNSRKRKDIRKERRRLDIEQLRFVHLSGAAITPEIWQQFYTFYQTTYAKRSGHGGYLTKQFFNLLGKSMADKLVLVLAYYNEQGTETAIAGALNFCSDTTLYGRYWGCSHEIDGLHFETCYYQGMDYCIAQQLKKFDAGAQGEHKIARGFAPIKTYSNHWLAHNDLNHAVIDFLAKETETINRHKKVLSGKLPFKQL